MQLGSTTTNFDLMLAESQDTVDKINKEFYGRFTYPWENLAAWREYTKGEFSLRIISGDHFFLNTSRPHLLEYLARTLASSQRG